MSLSPHTPLSARLAQLLELLEPCRVLGDVGTDHALIPLHAVARGRAERAVAVDVRSAPLLGAAKNLRAFCLEDRIELVVGDGVAALEGRGVDAVVLAGLGGDTLRGWCEAAPRVVDGLEQLIVQPNRQLSGLRAWAYARGLWLRDERICWDNGRYFIGCAFGPGAGGRDPLYERVGLPPEQAFELGPVLLERGGPLARRYYEAELARFRAIAARTGAAPRALFAFEVALEYPSLAR